MSATLPKKGIGSSSYPCPKVLKAWHLLAVSRIAAFAVLTYLLQKKKSGIYLLLVEIVHALKT